MSKYNNIEWKEWTTWDGKHIIQGTYKKDRYHIGKAVTVPENLVGDPKVHSVIKKLIEVAIAKRMVRDGGAE